MKVTHATPFVNLDSIFEEGLDPMYAVTESDQKWVWLHTPRHTSWAIPHTCKRKEVPEEEVVVLEVDVPRTWLRSGGRGLWKCPDIIEPERIKVIEMDETLIMG